MSTTSKNIIHPLTISIVNTLAEIETLFMRRNYLPGLRRLHFLSMRLDPKDLDDELHENLRKETLIIERMQSRIAREQHMNRNRANYANWYSQLQAILWAKGYYSQEKYRGIDLSKFEIENQTDVEIY